MDDLSTASTATESTDTTQAQPNSQAPVLTPQQVAELTADDYKKVAKIKIDGKEQSITLQEAIKRAQKASAAEKRFEQASRLVQEAERARHLAQNDPKAFLKGLGYDLDQMADQVMKEQIQRSQMTEEQRRDYERDQEFKKIQAERDSYQKQIKAQEEGFVQSQVEKQIDQEYAQAIKELNYPKNSYLVQRAAVEQIRALKRGEMLSAKEALVRIKEEFFDSSRTFLSDAQDKVRAIREMYGDDIIKQILKSEVERVKGIRAQQQTPPSAVRSDDKPVPPRPRQSKKYYSEKEFAEWQRSLRSR